MFRAVLCSLLALMVLSGRSFAEVSPEAAQALYDRVSPSLVAVQYTWESELGRRELVGAGVIVAEEGLVMTSLAVFDMRIPDEQMKEFKIIVPRLDGDNEELDAVFEGRDERTNLAFVRTVEPQQWQALHFEDVPVQIGEPILSVGLLPEIAGYRTAYNQSIVSATLRGEVLQVMVGAGALGPIGSPAFNSAGEAVGIVNMQPNQPVFLNDPQHAIMALTSPPRFFVPTRDFLLSLQDPPTGDGPMKLPWVGIPQMAGLQKDVAEFFGLENQPAVEVGDVIADTPADRGGLRPGDVIVQINGEALERGDRPEDLPQILRRQLLRMQVGDEVTFSVLRVPGEPLEEITVVLEEQPPRPNTAARHFAEDLGFTARETVLLDSYIRRVPADTLGVVIALIKPQSSAENAGLQVNDLVTEMNGEPVTNLEQFRREYQSFRRENPREAVVMVVIREGGTQVIRIEPPQ